MTIPIIFIEGIEFRKALDKHDTPCVYAIGAKEDIEAAQAVLARNGYDASFLEWTESGWRVWGHRKPVEVSQEAIKHHAAVLADAKKVKAIRMRQKMRRVLR